MFIALYQVSKDGVADPIIIGMFKFFALIIATSLAWYRNPSLCLKEGSCSSSIIMIFRLGMGVKMPNLVPMIISALPIFASLQLSNRSISDK